MPSVIPIAAENVIILAGDNRVRQLTEWDSDVRQKRNGQPLISLQAEVVVLGRSQGIVTVQTSERDLSDVQPGQVLLVRGSADLTNSGTKDDYGLRTVFYAEHLEPIQVNAWSVVTEAVRRATQAATK